MTVDTFLSNVFLSFDPKRRPKRLYVDWSLNRALIGREATKTRHVLDSVVDYKRRSDLIGLRLKCFALVGQSLSCFSLIGVIVTCVEVSLKPLTNWPLRIPPQKLGLMRRVVVMELPQRVDYVISCQVMSADMSKKQVPDADEILLEFNQRRIPECKDQ
jgi:hypothetical protein